MRYFLRNQQGSVIWFIFIGIAVFAALGFAVSRMMQGESGQRNQEMMVLMASDILQFGRSMRTTIQGMQVNGVGDHEISFEHGSPALYTNANCTGFDCRVFHPSGGALQYIEPFEDWFNPAHAAEDQYGTWYFTGANRIPVIGTDAGGTPEELLVMVPWINRSLCEEINVRLGLMERGGTIPRDSGTVELGSRFAGSYGPGTPIDTTPAMDSVRVGCFRDASIDDGYHFYQVLIAR